MKSMLRTFACAAVIAAAVTAPAFADDLDEIKADNEFSFAMSGAFPPFSFVDENNQVVGFDVDIGDGLAKRLGVQPKVVTTAWDGIIAGLKTGKYDAVIGSMTITPERAKAVDFVGPYYHGGRGAFVPEDSPVQTLDDLQGKTVGLTLGETHEKWARDHGGWTIRTYKSIAEMTLELRAGRIDAIIADKIPVLVQIKEQNEPIRQVEIPGPDGTEEVGIAIRKDNPELKAALEKGLAAMQADGSYEAISMKWIGRDIR